MRNDNCASFPPRLIGNRGTANDVMDNRAIKNRRRPLAWRLSAYVVNLGALILAGAVFILFFGDVILNGYWQKEGRASVCTSASGLRVVDRPTTSGAR